MLQPLKHTFDAGCCHGNARIGRAIINVQGIPIGRKGGATREKGRAWVEPTINLVPPVCGCQDRVEFVALEELQALVVRCEYAQLVG